MAHTIFILGTDTEHCKKLRDILQERNPEAEVVKARFLDSASPTSSSLLLKNATLEFSTATCSTSWRTRFIARSS
jgi:hypothetical protein